MAQRTNPAAVSFEADGETYTLLCDMNALVDFEAHCKIPAFEVLSTDMSVMSVTHQRGLFWAMLQEHHPGIDPRAAGRLLGKAKEEMWQALRLAFPEPDDQTGKQTASATTSP